MNLSRCPCCLALWLGSDSCMACVVVYIPPTVLLPRSMSSYNHALLAWTMTMCVQASSLMSTCVVESDLVGLRRLLAAGARPDWCDYDGRAPLHVAAAEGNLAAVQVRGGPCCAVCVLLVHPAARGAMRPAAMLRAAVNMRLNTCSAPRCLAHAPAPCLSGPTYCSFTGADRGGRRGA